MLPLVMIMSLCGRRAFISLRRVKMHITYVPPSRASIRAIRACQPRRKLSFACRLGHRATIWRESPEKAEGQRLAWVRRRHVDSGENRCTASRVLPAWRPPKGVQRQRGQPQR